MAEIKTYSTKTEMLYATIIDVDVINDTISKINELQGNKPLKLCLYTAAGRFIGIPKSLKDKEIDESQPIVFNEDKTSFKISMVHLMKLRNDYINKIPEDYVQKGEPGVIYLTEVEHTTNNGDKINMPETYIFADSVVSFSLCQ